MYQVIDRFREGYLTKHYLYKAGTTAWLQCWQTGENSLLSDALKKKERGPFRFRAAVPDARFVVVYVVGDESWIEDDDSSFSGNAQTSSVVFAGACGLDFCRITWAVDAAGKAWPTALDPFPDLPQQSCIADLVVDALVRRAL